MTFSKFTCIPERPGGRSGPGRSERAWPSGGLGTQRPRVRARPLCGPRGQAGGHRDSAGHWSGAAPAPNAAAAWHRRTARPVHANGRRARYELFSSGAERTSAARRAAWAARPPPLQSGRTDFPNFPRPAPWMRPPRRRGPRPSALAALPPLPPILCLLSRSWHLSQRARFPAHPFAAGSGRGRGHGGPGRRGRGKRGARAPCVLGRPPGGGGGGRARAPGHPCSARRSGLRTRPEYQRGRRARCGPVRLGAAPPGQPPPGRARSGWAGGGSCGFAAPALLLAPQLRVRAPAGTPPRALPACARPPRGPARRPRAPTLLGIARRRPTRRAPRPTQRGGLNRSASPARAALARRRLPGRAPRLRSKAPAAMIAGSTGARARALGADWDPRRTAVPSARPQFSAS